METVERDGTTTAVSPDDSARLTTRLSTANAPSTRVGPPPKRTAAPAAPSIREAGPKVTAPVWCASDSVPAVAR